MDWDAAVKLIEAEITVGLDVNTPRSTHRFVEAIGRIPDSTRYGYESEFGFTVRIGDAVSISIPLRMLYRAFLALEELGRYDGNSFRTNFPKQAADHPCHVHVVGEILTAAGLAVPDGSVYVRPAS